MREYHGSEALPSGKQRCFSEVNFQENDWYLNFRMPIEAFSILCDQLHPYINPQTTNMLDPVPLGKRVAVTIYKLASNVEFHDVAKLFGFGTSTACNIFWEVCGVLSKLRRVFVKSPSHHHRI